MLNLTLIELEKIARRGRSYIGFLAIAVIVMVLQLAIYIDGENVLNVTTQNLQESFAFEGNLLNGYLTVYVVLNTLWVHIPFLIALIAGDMIAGEANIGTFRLLLIRPVSRFKLLSAKYLATLTYTFLIILWMAIFSIGFGIALFGTGDLIVVKSNVFVFSENDVMWRILGAYAFSFLSMGTVAGLAFLFSAFVNNAIGPIISTVTVIICFMIISNIDLSLFKMLKPFMFTTYMAKWMLFFETPLNKKELLEAVFVLLFHILMFFGITVLYFRKKDILT